jgi:hypothetical protein
LLPALTLKEVANLIIPVGEVPAIIILLPDQLQYERSIIMTEVLPIEMKKEILYEECPLITG